VVGDKVLLVHMGVTGVIVHTTAWPLVDSWGG